jgi:hypothetical protein
MQKKRKANARDGLNFGRGSLVGRVKPPFGIRVRPVNSQKTESPFPAWQNRPSYLRDPFVMDLGETGVKEPIWVYLASCGGLIVNGGL